MFYTSLIKNRPTFVEYFLTAGVDPRTITKIHNTKKPQETLSNLYKSTYDKINKVNKVLS
jgi:hypothetical protein